MNLNWCFNTKETLNNIAKDILSDTAETPFNKELLEEWRRVAIETNVESLYNTYENYE